MSDACWERSRAPPGVGIEGEDCWARGSKEGVLRRTGTGGSLPGISEVGGGGGLACDCSSGALALQSHTPDFGLRNAGEPEPLGEL